MTAKKLQVIVEGMFAIKISESTARRLMKKLGFTYITPPPSTL
ncbi:MAG: winged helix-turn-helix domain-containing protein [Wolbachia sp.]